MSFFSKQTIDSDVLLEKAIAEALTDASAVTVRVIAAVAGLLAAVAYADRTITERENMHLRTELRRLSGFSPAQVDAVAQLLSTQALRLSTTFVPRFARVLREEVEVEGRIEILDALLGMAAADGVITHDEVTSLRTLSTALGLSQAHYNQLQLKYRGRLESLR